MAHAATLINNGGHRKSTLKPASPGQDQYCFSQLPLAKALLLLSSGSSGRPSTCSCSRGFPASLSSSAHFSGSWYSSCWLSAAPTLQNSQPYHQAGWIARETSWCSKHLHQLCLRSPYIL